MQKFAVLLETTAALVAAAGAFGGCGSTTSGRPAAAKPDSGAARIDINQDVDSTLGRPYAEAGGTRELVAKADGVLVFSARPDRRPGGRRRGRQGSAADQGQAARLLPADYRLITGRLPADYRLITG